MKKWARLPAALCGFMLAIALLYLAVISLAFAPELYPQTPPYDQMAVALTDYLSEKQPELSPALFNEQERVHMEDVLHLFQGGKRIATFCLIGALVCGLGAAIWGGRKRLGQGLLIGIGAFGAVLLMLGLWALIDFSGWFTAMHQIVFTNDLWLFDPSTSMLINMLPETFFRAAAGTIALRFGISLVVLILLGVAFMRPAAKKEPK